MWFVLIILKATLLRWVHNIPGLNKLSGQKSIKFFLVVFWKIDDFTNTFWLHLTFSSSGGGSGKFATLKKSLFLVVIARDARAVLALVICIWKAVAFLGGINPNAQSHRNSPRTHTGSHLYPEINNTEIYTPSYYPKDAYVMSGYVV